MKRIPPAVSFVARSGSGKTTLLEKVILALTCRGWLIGAVKHHGHEFTLDHEGKDSWRLAQAGSSPVVLASAGSIAVLQTGLKREIPIAEIIERFMAGTDLVIVEGYKSGPLPKIEIHRSGRSDGLLCISPDGVTVNEDLLAVVSDDLLQLPVPVLPLNDPAVVGDFLEEMFLGGQTPVT